MKGPDMIPGMFVVLGLLFVGSGIGLGLAFVGWRTLWVGTLWAAGIMFALLLVMGGFIWLMARIGP